MEFFTPPQHIGFKATKLYEQRGNIKDISLAYVDKDGGGPVRAHTHAHDHLFTVIEGEAKIVLKDESVIVKKGESLLVKGDIPHSVWNNKDSVCIMLGTSLINDGVEN